MIISTKSTMNLIHENIYLKCRVCVRDIENPSQAITIFCKDFLDEKIKKYLHVNIDFSDKFHKRICRDCLIKLEDIHQFACLAQKNQQIFIKYAEFKNTRNIKSPTNLISQSTTIPATTTTITNSIIGNGSKFMRTTPLISNDEITIFAYDELKLGQIIKDQGLLKLILKALKWDMTRKKIEEQLEILKNSNFQDILGNPALLLDEDLMHLLGPYISPEIFSGSNNINKPGPGSVDSTSEDAVTEMEVGVDPDLFFPDDDDETRSAEETIQAIVENEIKPLICSSCPMTFSTQSALQEHILNHLIDKQKLSEQKIKEAKNTKENKPIPIPKKSTGTSKKRRKRACTSRFTCTMCGKKLSTKGNLKVHIETHKPKGKFNCDKCGRIFKTYINLVRHKKYHSGDQFSCPTCNRVYPTSSTLRAHIITHSNLRPHECTTCGKTFKRNQDLKFHINQHTGNKPYKCPFCPKAFASSGNCFSHRKRMHSNRT